MNRMSVVSVLVIAAWSSAVLAAEAIRGQWMIDRASLPDRIQLTLHRSNAEGSSHTNSSPFPLSQLKGLSRPDMDSPTGSTVRFEIVRDAGTLACEGYFKQGSGAGAFTFSPDPGFITDMRALGYSGLSQEQVFAMAVHDVTRVYVRELRSLGVKASADDLISMRIHNVTVEYIKELQSLGYGKLQPDHLVTMRIHGVEPDFIRELNKLGYRSVSTDELVTMRIHGATTEFIRQIKALGFDPSVDQLVTMRIHGVTPEFIQKLRAQGLKGLSIDQLVNLRIHGIAD
jgi:hypothetical protein